MSSSARGKGESPAARTAVFGVFSALMFASKYLMEILPNIHLLALFLGVLTVVYRLRALIPLYGYVLLDGLFHGFSLWWTSYLYIFLPLVFGYLLIPTRWPRALRAVLYSVVAALHGLFFGLLYLPTQILLFGLDTPEAILAWLAAGLPFDLMHAVSNAAFATLILPISKILLAIQKGK